MPVRFMNFRLSQSWHEDWSKLWESLDINSPLSCVETPVDIFEVRLSGTQDRNLLRGPALSHHIATHLLGLAQPKSQRKLAALCGMLSQILARPTNQGSQSRATDRIPPVARRIPPHPTHETTEDETQSEL